MRGQLWHANLGGIRAHHPPEHLLAQPRPPALAGFVTTRNSLPCCTPEAANHSLIQRLTQLGTGTVRTRLPLPHRSSSTQRASRCRCSTVSAISSERLSPQPIS